MTSIGTSPRRSASPRWLAILFLWFGALATASLVVACRRSRDATTSGSALTAPTKQAPPRTQPSFTRSRLPRVDVHTHIQPGGMARALMMLGAEGIVHAVNLTGGYPGGGLEEQLQAAAQTRGRVTTFATPDWRQARHDDMGQRLAALLARSRQLGARGLKISKALGLAVVGPDGRLVAVDDPRLDALFGRAGALAMPVAIHTGDPKAFWLPPTPINERYDELVVHPEWSFYGQPVPSWQALFSQLERRIARHPDTRFIAVHFGNDPEDPEQVARLLERYPNLWIDTAARIPEIGRHDPANMRAFFVRFQDRILLGSDTAYGPRPTDLMLGSTGADPPTDADVHRFWDETWRYFETADRAMPHPTPIQGRWTIDAVALPPDVLRKVYAGNAAQLLSLTLPEGAE